MHCTPDLFELAQRERRTRFVKQYLADSVDVDVHVALVQAMGRDFADLGMDVAMLAS
jgi:hypothetical protein